mgnify:CR=1 FL=1
MPAKTIIIDTREPFEYGASHVEGAVNIPPADFMGNGVPKVLENAAKNTKIILYCRSGQRSNTCSMILRQHGFTNLVNGTNEGRVRQMLAS